MRTSAICDNETRKKPHCLSITTRTQTILHNSMLSCDTVSFNGRTIEEKLLQARLFNQMRRRQLQLIQEAFGFELKDDVCTCGMMQVFSRDNFTYHEATDRSLKVFKKVADEYLDIIGISGQNRAGEFIGRVYDNTLLYIPKTEPQYRQKDAYRLRINAACHQDGVRVRMDQLPQQIKDMLNVEFNKNGGWHFTTTYQGREFGVTKVEPAFLLSFTKPYIRIQQTNLTPNLISESIKLQERVNH